MRTQVELDDRLVKVRLPAPIIWVGPDFPIDHWVGWGDPHPNYYKGARVCVDPRLGDTCWVEEVAQIWGH